MVAHEFIEQRTIDLKRKIAQNMDIINHHKRLINEFSALVTEQMEEVKDLNKLMGVVAGA